MTSKLAVYNESLGHLEERKLASLSENREPRRVLDDYYAGTLKYCLERGKWDFAMRSVQADSSASITPTFGYAFAFTKPSDWVRTHQVSANESLVPQLQDWTEEPNLWYSNADPLFIRYISDNNAYGGDLSIWPETFADYVSIRLAARAARRITGSSELVNGLRSEERRALGTAQSIDAMNGPPGIVPTGSWVRSRGGGMSSRDRWDGTMV